MVSSQAEGAKTQRRKKSGVGIKLLIPAPLLAEG